MSCRVLDSLPDEEIEVLPWLRNVGSPRVAQRKPSRAADLAGEASTLRAQLEQTTAAAERQVREAFEKGALEGESRARQQLESASRDAVGKLAEAITAAAQERAEALRRAESDTVRLAVEIARRVLHRELSVDPAALEGLIKAAIEKLIHHEILRIKVHPALEKILAECIARTGRGQSIEIIPDPSQPAGGVVFGISRGTLDASLDTQLREIERGLIDELKTRA